MTDVQQAVPVTQLSEAIRRAKMHAGRVLGISWCNLEEISRVELILNELDRSQSLPCKSGEGAGEIGDFVMVPRKLTDDMLEAVVKLDFTSTHDPLWPEYWAAMLDAAPTVPDATQTREAELLALVKRMAERETDQGGCLDITSWLIEADRLATLNGRDAA